MAAKPRCTRDDNTRLSVRASAEWLYWLESYARFLNCSVAFLVERSLEDFATVRGYPKPMPRRYVRSQFFNHLTGEWSEELPIYPAAEIPAAVESDHG